MTYRNHALRTALRALLPAAATLVLGTAACANGDSIGDTPIGPETTVDDLDEEQLAEVELYREAIERGLHLGKGALADELNLVLESHGIVERYVMSLDSGDTYFPPDTNVSCDFISTAGANTGLECRAMVTYATVSAYARGSALRMDNPLGDRFDEVRKDGEFWYSEGMGSGIDNEATLAIAALRQLGACDQEPTPTESAFEAGVEQGRQLYIDRLNERLAELGQTMSYPGNVVGIEVCDANQTMLDPALSRALDDVDSYATSNRLCESFNPTNVEEVALRDEMDRKFEAGIEQGATTEHSLAEEAIFTVVPCNTGDPLVVDVAGDGVSLEPVTTSQAQFDLFDTGRAVRTAWIRGDDALLVLDRDGNGAIDNGRELFGNFVGDSGYDEVPTGFDHLAQYDRASEGGNEDCVIDARDAVFSRLRLWQDRDGDGRSHAAELFTLGELGVASIELSYAEHDGGDAQLSHLARFVRTGEGEAMYGAATANVYDAWFRHGRARVW